MEACDGDQAEWERRWQELDAALAAENAADDGARAPYPGLNAFEVHDAERFFGRERVVAELCSRLPRGGLLAVFGPSGWLPGMAGRSTARPTVRRRSWSRVGATPRASVPPGAAGCGWRSAG